jgi:hypothetical protein
LRVLSATIDITPKEVSWSEGKKKSRRAPGAELVAVVKWQAGADGTGGSKGQVHVKMPGFSPKFRSGDGYYTNGQWAFRDATVYGSPVTLSLGRLAYAFYFALPLAVLVQSIWWLFKFPRIRRAQAAADIPPPETPLPRTFSPNPVAEWQMWSGVMMAFAGIATMLVAVSAFVGGLTGVMGVIGFCVLAGGTLIALLCVRAARARVVTVRIDADRLAFAKGRGLLRWNEAPWRELPSLELKVRTYKGNRTEWLEIVLPDGKKHKIHANHVADFPALRDTALALFAHHHPV